MWSGGLGTVVCMAAPGVVVSAQTFKVSENLEGLDGRS
jgi:hypothetical protein